MFSVLSRSVELDNATSPRVVIELTEVERGERHGKKVVSLQPGQRTKIRGSQFMDRFRSSSIPLCVHVTAKLRGHELVEYLPANDFAVYGKLKFGLVDGNLSIERVVMSNFRRLKWFGCDGGN